MDCTICGNEPMVVLEIDRVEIDHCLKCGGIWLDAGEIELLLEGVGEKANILGSFEVISKSKEAKRKCPVCLKKMDKISCGRGKEVIIDKCRNNHGLWFDRWELNVIIEHANLDKNNKIVSLLRDMFTPLNPKNPALKNKA